MKNGEENMFIDPERIERPSLRVSRLPEPEYHRGVDWKWLIVWTMTLIVGFGFWCMVLSGVSKLFAHHVSTIPAHMITLR